MNVVLVCPTYPPNDVPCGVGDFTGILAPALAERGVEVTIVASAKYRGSMPVVTLAEPWNHDAVRRIARIATERRADVVNVQYTPDLYGHGAWMKWLPAWLRVAARVPVVLTPHTLVGGHRSAKWLAPVLLAPARRIIAPNREVATVIARRLPIFRARVREIPIGSNIPVTTESRDTVRTRVGRDLEVARDALLLAHFGFVYPGKGIETVLGAARRLRARGLLFTLLMIGGAGPGAEAYYATLRSGSRDLGRHVRWFGHTAPADVAALLAASDIYIAAYDDGISARRGTLLAGLSHGLPTVGTRPVLPDPRFRDGEHVVLVPPRDETALADALIRVVASPVLRAALSAAATKVAADFAWPAIADATLGVYREAR
jgi:glycosyltransferase involved in cell wall biosynthesis